MFSIRKKKVLLAKHHNGNVWVIPGGMVEPDEAPEAAAIREMREETGCEVKVLQTIATYGGPAFRIQYQNGDQVGYVMTLYKAEIVSGELRPDGKEILDVRFFSYEESKTLNTGRWMSIVLKDVFEDRKPGIF